MPRSESENNLSGGPFTDPIFGSLEVPGAMPKSVVRHIQINASQSGLEPIALRASRSNPQRINGETETQQVLDPLHIRAGDIGLSLLRARNYKEVIKMYGDLNPVLFPERKTDSQIINTLGKFDYTMYPSKKVQYDGRSGKVSTVTFEKFHQIRVASLYTKYRNKENILAFIGVVSPAYFVEDYEKSGKDESALYGRYLVTGLVRGNFLCTNEYPFPETVFAPLRGDLIQPVREDDPDCLQTRYFFVYDFGAKEDAHLKRQEWGTNMAKVEMHMIRSIFNSSVIDLPPLPRT